MPTITVPEETYQKLTRRAEAMQTIVDELLAQLAVEPQLGEPPEEFSREEKLQALKRIAQRAAARADRYPPGHVTDSSRESIYEGCGE